MSQIACHWLSKSINLTTIRTEEIASVRLRLGAALTAAELKISTGQIIPKETKIVIWPKFSWKNEKSIIQYKENISAAKKLKNLKIKQIVDYTDHHLEKKSPIKDDRSKELNYYYELVAEKNRQYYGELLNIVDYVTVSSHSMKTTLIQEGCVKQIWMIPDAIDQITFNFEKEIVSRENEESIGFWFGSHYSFQQLIENLENLNDQLSRKITLNCLVQDHTLMHAKKGHYKFPKVDKINLHLNVWSLDKMEKYAKNSDFIFIPSNIKDPRRKHASSNRLITAFSFARPVVATSINSYEEFQEFFINFQEPETKLFFENINAHKLNLIKAKEISENFKIEVVGKIWAQTIKEMLCNG